ncbi:MAG: TRAP transporter substrate-binding protein DctP [Desulfobacteraceae bacterium]|jgi:TRAP-type C4-dicarboxylate transport system substrate-binding protein
MKILKWITIYLLAGLLLAPCAQGAGKAVVVKLATLAPEGSTWMEIFNQINAEVIQATDGRVRFRIYPGGVLGDERDMLRKMHIGQIHSAALSAPAMAGLFKEIDIFQIPFLFQTYAEVDYVLGQMSEFFKQGFEKSGYVLLDWSEVGFVRLMSTVPIATLENLKQAKVWTWEDAPISNAIFNEANIAAIPLTVPDVLVGLQTGLVDVVYAPPAGAIALQWFTKVKFVTDVPLIYLAGGIVIDKNVLQRISSEHRQLLMQIMKRNMIRMKSAIRKDNQDALRVMEKHGVKTIVPTAEEVEKFKQLSTAALQYLGGVSFSQATLDRVHVHLARFREGRP